MRIFMLPVLLVLAILGSSAEAYTYGRSLGREMYARDESPRAYIDEIHDLKLGQKQLVQKVREHDEKISALLKKA